MSEVKAAKFASLFNGLVALISGLASKGLVNQHDLDFLMEAMSKPFDIPELAGDEEIALYRERVEQLIATIKRETQTKS